MCTTFMTSIHALLDLANLKRGQVGNILQHLYRKISDII